MAQSSFAFPKPQYWQQFEDLTLEVFKYALGDRTPAKHGRGGQKQHGVDVYGRALGGNGQLVGIQCKRREEKDQHGHYLFGDGLNEKELVLEVRKAEGFTPALDQFIVATTAPADAKIQRWIEELNEDRWHDDADAFRLAVWHWQDYEAYLNGNVDLQKWYFAEVVDHFGRERASLHILSLLRDAFSRAAFRDPLKQENPRNFRLALEHTQRAVDTGELLDRVTGLTIRKAIGGAKALESATAKKRARKLTNVLTKLRTRFDWATKAPFDERPQLDVTRIVDRGDSLIIYDEEIAKELDALRAKAITIVNELLREAALDEVDSALL